jgi:hypothetical protein
MDALIKDSKKFEKEEVGLAEKKKHLVTKQKKLKKTITDVSDRYGHTEVVTAPNTTIPHRTVMLAPKLQLPSPTSPRRLITPAITSTSSSTNSSEMKPSWMTCGIV